jgi:hypothetical protein
MDVHSVMSSLSGPIPYCLQSIRGRGLCVYRLHGIFGAHHTTSAASAISNDITPFNLKRVVLEVFGPRGTVATINLWMSMLSRNHGRAVMTSGRRCAASVPRRCAGLGE